MVEGEELLDKLIADARQHEATFESWCVIDRKPRNFGSDPNHPLVIVGEEMGYCESIGEQVAEWLEGYRKELQT